MPFKQLPPIPITPFHDPVSHADRRIVHQRSKRAGTYYQCLRCRLFRLSKSIAAVAFLRSPSQRETWQSVGVCWQCASVAEREQAELLPRSLEARQYR